MIKLMVSFPRSRLSKSLALLPLACMLAGAPVFASEQRSWLEELLDRATRTISKQEQAEHKHESDKAYQLILQNLAKDPQNVQLLTAVVKQLGGNFKWQEAEPYMRRLLAVDPFNEANIEFAEYLAGNDATREQAVSILQGVLSKHNGNKRARRDFGLMGAWYPATNKQALIMLEALHAENPEDYEVLLTLARANRWRSGDFVKAEKYYRECVKKHPTDVSLKIELAGTLNEQGKDKQHEAIALMDKLVKERPTSTAVRLARARILTNAKMMKEALADVEFLAKVSPYGITWDGWINGHSRRIPILLVAAQFANFSGQSKLSQQYYKEYLSKFPNDVDAKSELKTVIANSMPRRRPPVVAYVPPKLDPIQEALNKAYQLHADGKTDEAIELLEQIQKEHPTTKSGALVRWKYQADQPLDLLIAQYAVQSKQYEKAEQVYAHYLQDHPDDAAVRLDLSELQTLTGKHDAALESLKQVVAVAPDMQTLVYVNGETKSRDVTAALAQKLMLQHHYEEAKPRYQGYLQANPDDAQVRDEYSRMLSYQRGEKREQALALKRDGQEAEARQMLEAVVNEDSADMEAAIALAELRSKDDPQAASQIIDTFVNANPSADRVAVADRLAWPKPTRKIAERLLSEALRADPQNDKALLLMAHLESWDENTSQRAIRHLDEYLKHHPDDQQVKKELAGLLLWRGNPGRSVELFNELIARKPDDKALLLGLARAQHADRRKEMRATAAATMTQYLSAKGDDSEAKRELANWYCYDGKPKESLRLYDELLKQTPGSLDLLNGKAQVLALSGKIDPGLRLYRQVLERDPANHDALLGLGQVLSWTGDHFAAERVLKVAREKYGSDKLIQLETALNYRGMGRLDKAAFYVKQSLSSR